MIPVRIVYIKYQIFERPPKRDAHFLLWTSIETAKIEKKLLIIE